MRPVRPAASGAGATAGPDPGDVWPSGAGPINFPAMSLESLPGGDLIAEGFNDLAAGRESAAALLVSIAAPRLRLLGWNVPSPIAHPEERLYASLAEQYGDGAHSRYNALIRRLVSFQRAAACAK